MRITETYLRTVLARVHGEALVAEVLAIAQRDGDTLILTPAQVRNLQNRRQVSGLRSPVSGLAPFATFHRQIARHVPFLIPPAAAAPPAPPAWTHS